MTVLRRILRATGWSAVGLFVAAFLVGYAAPYLSPTPFWWTDLFAVFVPLLGVGVGVLALSLCGWGYFRRRWGRMVVGGALLLLLVVRFGPRLAMWGTPGTETEVLRLMTFNVPPALGGARSEGGLTGLIQQETPDVLALQESHLTTTAGGAETLNGASSALRTLLESSLGYAPARALPSATTIQQPVLGRVPLDSMSVHRLPPAGERSPRSRYTRTQFTWQGQPAVLYNLHLQSVGKARPWTLLPEEWTSVARWKTFLKSYREGALRRAQQARLIRRHIERETRPVIVVGDFNSTPHQWAYRHIAQGLQSAVNRRLWGWGATYPARRPLVQIDHVLAGPAWQITAVRIPVNGEPGLSDHRPVVAHLRWKTGIE